MKFRSFYSKRILTYIIFSSIFSFAVLTSCTNESTKEKQTTMFDIEFSKINNFYFDVEGKENIDVLSATEEQISIPSVDKNNYGFKIRIFSRDQSNYSISVEIVLSDLKDNFVSKSKIVIISGFKPSLNKIINSDVNSVKIDYPNSLKIFANQSLQNQLSFSNYQLEKYELLVKDFVKKDNSVIVKFLIKNKKTNEESYLREAKITDFKHWVTKDEINAEVQKVNVSIPKSLENQNEIKIENLIVEGLNSSLFEIKIEYKIVHSNLIVSWKLLQKNTINNFSIKRSIILPNFFHSSTFVDQKVMDAEIDKVILDYLDKDFIEIKDTNKFGVIFRNLSSDFIPIILEFTQNKNEKSILVKFQIQYTKNKNIKSKEASMKIQGFVS